MGADRIKKRGAWQRLWQWLGSRLVQDVPEEDAVCEFQCNKLECPYGDWATCERRLRGMAHKRGGSGQDEGGLAP